MQGMAQFQPTQTDSQFCVQYMFICLVQKAVCKKHRDYRAYHQDQTRGRLLVDEFLEWGRNPIEDLFPGLVMRVLVSHGSVFFNIPVAGVYPELL